MNPSLYLVKRREKPIFHRATFHPVILCTRQHTAMWEAGWSGDGACVWTRDAFKKDIGGWLMVRWCGLDIDYGHIVRNLTLPDGTTGAFVHDRKSEPWTLIPEAVWWSDHKIPDWISDCGVNLPEDDFSRDRIREDQGSCLLTESKQEQLKERRLRMIHAGRLLDLVGDI